MKAPPPRIGPWLSIPLLTLLLAGCTEEPGPTTTPTLSALDFGLVTPGHWYVNGTTDFILAWFHNTGKTTLDVNVSVTRADGLPWPPGWAFSYQQKQLRLNPVGTNSSTDRGQVPTDWGWTYITLAISGNRTGEQLGTPNVQAVLNAGTQHRPFDLVVSANATSVTKIGSKVDVQYTGRFAATGKTFDSGSFQTVVGSGQTVPGFDYGLLGLGLHERADIVVHPPLGYGYNPPASHAQFKGQTLVFTVEPTKIA